MLREAGHRVSFFDAMLAEGIDEYQCLLETDRPELVLFYEDNFNFLSKMCLGTMRRAACEMIGSAKRVGARVVVAGPDVTDAPGAYLKAGADLALLGEDWRRCSKCCPSSIPIRGHRTAILQGRERSRVAGRRLVAQEHLGQGTAGSRGGPRGLGLSGRRALPRDVDEGARLFQFEHGRLARLSVSLRVVRKTHLGNHYLQRDAADVAAEMLHLKRRFAPDHIWFADDIFGFRVDWVVAFAAAVRAAGAAIPFTIQTRADLVSVHMAEALRDAGCREAWIGAESGSQRVLDAMHKGTTVEEIRTARDRLKSVGIRVGFFIQLGYMDEQLTDILATRDLLDEARPDEIGVSVSYPLPGTKFYELVKAQLHGKTHWQESNDLEMMFQGTYTSDFYRTVRNLMHYQITLQGSSAAACDAGGRAQSALEQRWVDLISQEQHYRSALARSAATG